MEIEEIDDNSSQDAICPATTTPFPAKTRKKPKKGPPVLPSSSTLTRFLGPRGTPSVSVWEDENRQCPVCQQSGFSSRSLALHVNGCLDAGNGSSAGVRKGTARAGEQGQEATTAATAAAAVLARAVEGRSNLSSCSAWTAGERASGISRTGNSGNRERAGEASREPSRTTKRGTRTTGAMVVDSTGEQVPRPKTANVAEMAIAAKTDLSHQDPPRTAERSGASTRVSNYGDKWPGGGRGAPVAAFFCFHSIKPVGWRHV